MKNQREMCFKKQKTCI